MARRPGDLKDRVRVHLAALAKRAGMTQMDLARATGYRQQEINRFFLGSMKHPPLEFMDALARAFQRRLTDVLAEELPPATLSDAEMTLLANWRALPAQEQWAFERLLFRRPHTPDETPKRRRAASRES